MEKFLKSKMFRSQQVLQDLFTKIQIQKRIIRDKIITKRFKKQNFRSLQVLQGLFTNQDLIGKYSGINIFYFLLNIQVQCCILKSKMFRSRQVLQDRFTKQD
jgi:hypothetical protein